MKRLLVVALIFPLACGEASDPSDRAPSVDVNALEPDTSEASCPDDDSARDLEFHACLHARSGPFANVTASDPAGAPSISKSHTSFEVLFPAPEQRWLSFQARGASVYVFYSSPKTRLALRRPNGDRVPVTCEGPMTDACTQLTYQVQVQLEASETIYVALFPESEGLVKLIVERVD